MPWQPMPAMARLPSGSRVEVLCGQPEQKNGVRCEVIGALPVAGWSKASRRARRCSSSGLWWPSRRSRATIAEATTVGFSSPSLGNSGAPSSSRLPTMLGRFAASML